MTPTVSREGDFIAIRQPNGGSYDVPLRQVNTPEEAISWALHLAGKTWITAETLADFLYEAATARGWEVHP